MDLIHLAQKKPNLDAQCYTAGLGIDFNNKSGSNLKVIIIVIKNDDANNNAPTHVRENTAHVTT